MNLYEVLPVELIEIIWKYIPMSCKALLTKEQYETYHEEYILSNIQNYSGFIRYVIRENMYYVFRIHLNYDHNWKAQRSWKYKKQTYCDFAEYVYFYSTKYPRIHYLLKEFEKVKRKNKHRKMKSKYIIWTN